MDEGKGIFWKKKLIAQVSTIYLKTVLKSLSRFLFTVNNISNQEGNYAHFFELETGDHFLFLPAPGGKKISRARHQLATG